MYKNGYKKAEEDMEEMGLNFVIKRSSLMHKATGIDKDFIAGYTYYLEETIA